MVRILISLAAAGIAAAAANAPVQAVPRVDLARYAGKWYEIARLPNWFQRGCAGAVTATYTLRADGRITVLNECRTSEGRAKRISGTGRLADAREPNGKLKVTFFWPFSANYWIIGLDADYRWALVGDPGRGYLWILSREPKISDALYREITALAARQGFDTG
ncbi:MAG: lipocalin family protein [Acidobacteriota bacterium]|nr:lipocalin family protein [Acidobacteriota bacterium]